MADIIRSVVEGAVEFAITMHEGKCPICYEALDASLILLPCRHPFHDRCIRQWFEQTGNCPMCRYDMEFMRLEKYWKIPKKYYGARIASGFLSDCFPLDSSIREKLEGLEDPMSYEDYRFYKEVSNFVRVVETSQDPSEMAYWSDRMNARVE